jgi:hypothetical protein
LLIGFSTAKLSDMKLTELHLAIMNKLECSKEDADEAIMEMKERVKEGADPEEVLFENGFEPDYVFDLLFD